MLEFFWSLTIRTVLYYISDISKKPVFYNLKLLWKDQRKLTRKKCNKKKKLIIMNVDRKQTYVNDGITNTFVKKLRKSTYAL